MDVLSVLLWIKLNHYIGNEDKIFIRRRWSNLREEAMQDSECFKHFTVIESGSKGEGLDLEGSDIDNMSIYKNISVLPPSRLQIHRSDMIMDTDDIKPGFARLRIIDISNLQLICFAVVEVGNTLYASSLLFCQHFLSLAQTYNPNYILHGPCVTETSVGNTEIDNAVCFSCRMWPPEASEWMLRERPNNWPARDVIAKVVSSGCLFVPIGNPQSMNNHMEWRMSFSIAEKILIHSFNQTQFLCYGLLKLYLKHVIETVQDLKGVLCSYFLKTCLFYSIEVDNITWKKENIKTCFWMCFERLFLWVRQGYCPNYFIKSNNMFEYKIHGYVQKKLIDHLSQLYEYGDLTFTWVPCLKDVIDTIKQLFTAPTGILIEVRPFSRAEREFFGDVALFKPTCEYLYELFKTETVRRLLSNLHVQSGIKNYLVDSVILQIQELSFNSYLIQFTYQKLISTYQSNKSRITNLTEMKHFILRNCQDLDICTGWLQFATLCYLTGQYNEVISIIKCVMKKIEISVMYRGLGSLRYHSEEYMNRFCDKELNPLQRMKYGLARAYVCFTDCDFYPPEIKNIIKRHSNKRITFVPPVVYSYVLLFLSYNALGGIIQRNLSLIKLHTAVNENCFVSELEKPLVFAILQQIVDIYNRHM